LETSSFTAFQCFEFCDGNLGLMLSDKCGAATNCRKKNYYRDTRIGPIAIVSRAHPIADRFPAALTLTTDSSYVTGTSSGGALDGTTIAGALDMTQLYSSLTVTGGLTVSGATINVGQRAQLVFYGSQTLGGTGTVAFVNTSNAGLLVASGSTVTIAAGVTIHGNNGYVGNDPSVANVSLINHGTISADASGGTIIVEAATWSNQGSLQALNGSTLCPGGPQLPGNVGSWTNSGTIVGTTGFLFLTGTLDNTGTTLTLEDLTGPLFLTYGTIKGGTVSTAGNAELIGTFDSATLTGITLAGTLDPASTYFVGGNVTVTGGLTLNHGAIPLRISTHARLARRLHVIVG
jgi:hypothetical protein